MGTALAHVHNAQDHAPAINTVRALASARRQLFDHVNCRFIQRLRFNRSLNQHSRPSSALFRT